MIVFSPSQNGRKRNEQVGVSGPSARAFYLMLESRTLFRCNTAYIVHANNSKLIFCLGWVSSLTWVRSASRWAMRDARRRLINEKYASKRLRLRSITRCDVLPDEVRQKASTELAETLPRDSSITRVRNRCMLTGRPRGILSQFRLSRMEFRKLADAAELPGMTRSTW